jgi:hypothetical protein
MGKGRAFQETFSRLTDLLSFWGASTTGSCGGFAIKVLGIKTEPAAAATDVMKSLREKSANRVIGLFPPQADVKA